MKKVVLVAGDHAQSEVLEMFAGVLVKADCEVMRFLGGGQKPSLFSDEEILRNVGSADLLIAGMSEYSVQEVLAVKWAVKFNVEVALYADTYRASALPAFEPFRSCCLTIFVINEHEAKVTRSLFPNARVVVTGNPRWEKFFFPRWDKTEARAYLGIDEPDRKVILSVGDKFLAQNIIQFGATVDAIHMLNWQKDTNLLLGLHPGDPHDPKLYQELADQAGMPVKFVGKAFGVNTDDILPACDVVVNFTSTIAIQAACLRIPVIDFCSTVALKGRQPEIGTDPWELTKFGASLPVYCGSNEDLAILIQQLLSTPVKPHLQKAQAVVFPQTDNRGQALRLMKEALLPGS